MAGRAALLLGMVLVLCAAGATLALAQVGTLAVQQGELKLRHEGQSRIVKAQAPEVPVFAGDVLHSGPDAHALLNLTAGQATVDLYPSSYFTVQAASEDDTRLSLGIGKALFKVFARLKANARFQVQTQTAVIGVKGTDFIVGTDGETTFVLTLTGAVGLVSEAFAEREVVVTQDTVAAARRAEAPTPPQAVTPEVRDRAVKEPGLDTFRSLNLTGKDDKSGRKDAAAKVQESQQILKERQQDTGGQQGLAPTGRTGTIGGTLQFNNQ
jgi:hypothetical protein